MGVTGKNRTNRIKYNVKFGERITDLLTVWLYFIIDGFFIMTDRNSMNDCFRSRKAAPSKPTYFIVYYKFRQDQSSLMYAAHSSVACRKRKLFTKTIRSHISIFDIFVRFLLLSGTLASPLSSAYTDSFILHIRIILTFHNNSFTVQLI